MRITRGQSVHLTADVEHDSVVKVVTEELGFSLPCVHYIYQSIYQSMQRERERELIMIIIIINVCMFAKLIIVRTPGVFYLIPVVLRTHVQTVIVKSMTAHKALVSAKGLDLTFCVGCAPQPWPIRRA